MIVCCCLFDTNYTNIYIYNCGYELLCVCVSILFGIKVVSLWCYSDNTMEIYIRKVFVVFLTLLSYYVAILISYYVFSVVRFVRRLTPERTNSNH